MATIVEDGNLPEERRARSRLPGRSLSLLLLLPLLVATIWCAGQLGLQVVAPPIPPINPVRTADYQPWPYDSFSAINPLLVTLIAQQDGTAVAGIRVVSLPTATPPPTSDSPALLDGQTQTSPDGTSVAQANTLDPTQAGSLTTTPVDPTIQALTETAAPSGTVSSTVTQSETPTATGTQSPSPSPTEETETSTPSPTGSRTATPTGSASATRTPSSTATATRTQTPSRTPSRTPTSTGTTQALNAVFSVSPQVGPAPLTVTFTNLSTGPIASYFWSFGDGTGFSSAANPTYTYTNPGTYTVTLTIFDSGSGLDSASTLVIVGAQPTPTGTFTPVPATNTPIPPSQTLTNTIAPPTNTAVPPTNTAVPPTNTVAPPTFTSTFTNTFTPSLTPTSTATFTPTLTPSRTPTPTNTFTPRPTSAPGSTCPQWDEPDTGAPDGNYCDLAANASFIFDFSASPIVTGAGYDLVFYEFGYLDNPPPPHILMDRRIVEVGTSPTGPWIIVFNWGNNVADTNTNVGAAGYGAGNEAEDANIPMSVLYGTLPLQTGIAIDVDEVAPPGIYPYVRVRSYNGASNIDSVQVLNTGALAADLGLSMVVSDANPALGTNVTYTVTLTNTGSTTTNVQVSDVLPGGLSLVSSSASQGSYAGDVWNVGTVPGSSSATLDITARVVGTPGSIITNTATITASDLPDPNAANNSASTSLTIQITPVDLTIGVSVDNANPMDGTGVTYTLVVTNTSGIAAVGGVQITNVLQTGLTPGVASVSQGSYVGNTWDVGFLSAGANAVLTLPAIVEVGYAGATLNHSASITTANQPDPDAGNNVGNVSLVVQSVDLSVTITADNPTPAQNSTVIYTINVTNNGPNDATGVVVNAALPADVTYVSDDGGGSYNLGLAVWTVGSLANGASVTLNINVVAGVPTVVSFLVSLQPSEPGDTNTGNDIDNVDILVIPPPVAAFTANPVGGEEPLQVTFTNVSSGDISSYSWDFGDGVGTSTEVNPTYTYTTPNTYDVTLTVTGPGGTDVETAQITVILRQTDVSVTITADNPTPLPGGTVVYTVQVSNNGPRDTSGVTATFAIPPELTVDSVTPAQGSYAGGVWTLDPIAAGTTQTLTLNTTVGGSVPPATVVDVSVTLSTPNHTDTDPGNNSDVESVTVQ